MDFLKKHYEKIILGVVLIGLFGAVIALPIIKNSEDEAIKLILADQRTPRVQPLPGLNLAAQEATLKRMGDPGLVDFGQPHKLFNPMPWQKALDGHLILSDSTNVGPRAVQFVKPTPLYLLITLDSVAASESGTHYVFSITKENAPKASERSKTVSALGVGAKNTTFEVRAVEGPTNEPTALVLRLLDTDAEVKISKEKPFKRVDGYMADLTYKPESRTWNNQRVGATLRINGEDYKIVSISESEVVISAPNQKKWTIKYSPPSTNSLTNTPNTPPP